MKRTKNKVVDREKAGAGKRAAVIRTSIDPALREQADLVLGRLGLTTPDAVRIFLRQVVLHRGMPFEVRLPEVASPEEPAAAAWCEEVECAFRRALDEIDDRFGNTLRNLAK